MDDVSPPLSRRALLSGGVPVVAALAGCPVLESGPGTAPEESPLRRIVLRNDTDDVQRIRLTLVYAPPEGDTERPVWTTVEVHPDAEPKTAVQALETGAGTYVLTAASRHAATEVVSFNSQAESSIDRYQFEVVVQATGDLWVNLNEAGESISIPG